jgi:DNA repair protein RadC
MKEQQDQAIWEATYIREVRVNYVASDKPRAKVSGPVDIADFVRSVLIDNSREQFIAMYLDASHCVVGYAIITIGIANQTLIHPREVFQRAILSGATAVVVAHNHPSGSVEPSQEDVCVTNRLKEAGTLLGIQLLDHVIVSDFAFNSLREDIRCWS